MATTSIGGEWVGAIAKARPADSREQAESVLLESLCSAVREYLERQVALLNDEVRRYPRPISRCDVQLTGLLEQRAAALVELQRLESLGDRGLARADGIAMARRLVDLFLAEA
jgi:hypothetical protein